MKNFPVLFKFVIPLLLYFISSTQHLSAEHNDQINLDHVRLIELIEEIRFQDEVLTNSMTTYIYSGESRWLDRYKEAAVKFDTALSEIKQNYENIDQTLYKKLVNVSDYLYDIEEKALKKLQQGELDIAKKSLDSPEYLEQKALLIETINELAQRVETQIAKTEYHQHEITPIKLTEKEKQWIINNPEVIVGNESDWPPFNFINEKGSNVGIAIDYLNLISQKTGLNFIFSKPMTYAELHQKLRSSEIDIIAAAYYSEARSKYALHTPAYMIIKELFYVREDSDIQDIDDLNNRTLAVPSGYISIDLIREKKPEIKIIETKSVIDSIQRVLSGEVDATLDSESVIQYYMHEHALSGLRSFPSGLTNNPLRMLINGEKDILQRIITKAIESINRDERIRITSNWLHIKNVAPSAMAKPKSELTTAEHEWLNHHPIIRIGGDPDWRPFEFIDKQGQHRGIIADYISLIANQLGIEFQLPKINSWQETLDMFQAGEIDIITSLAATEERKKEFLLTEPYLFVPSVVITRKETGNIPDLNAMKNRKLGVVEGYSIIEWVNDKYPDVDLIYVNSISEGLKQVSEGMLDAMLANQLSAIDTVTTLALDNLKVNFITEFEYEIAIAVRKDWPELVPILNKLLSEVTPAERDAIRSKWVSSTLQEIIRSPENNVIDKIPIFKIIFITLALIAFFLISAWLLARYYGNVQKLYQSSNFRVLSALSVCSILIVVFIVTWISLSREEQITRQRAGESLQTVLSSTQDTLRFWVRNSLRQVALVANETDLQTLFSVFKSNSAGDSVDLKDESLKDLLKKQNMDINNLEITMIFSDGTSVFDNSISVEHLLSDLQQTVFTGTPVFIPPRYDPETDSVKLYFAAPVFDYTGQPIAAIVAASDPNDLFSEILLKSHIGTTGETYAVRHDGYMLSKSRFEEQSVSAGLLDKDESSILNIRLVDPGGNLLEGWKPKLPLEQLPLSIAASSIKKGDNGILTNGNRDYMGVPVISAWTWDSELGIGLISEIDESEALESYRISRNTLYTVLGISLFLSSVLMAFSAWVSERANRILVRAKVELEDKIEERTAELKQNASLFRSLMESSPNATLIVNEDDEIILSNKLVTELCGYTKEELEGVSVDILIPGGLRTKHKKRREQFLKKTEMREMGTLGDFSALKKDGSKFKVEISLSSINTENGILFAVTIRDVTEQKLYEQELKDTTRIMSRVFMAATDPILIENPDGIIIDANYAAIKAYHYNYEELINQPMKVLVPKDWYGQIDEWFQKVLSGEELRNVETVRMDKQNNIIPILLTKFPLKNENNEIIAVASIAKDITELKKVESELQFERKGLEKRVEKRTRELEEKMKELEEFNQLAVGRELRMIELKREINELSKSLGKKERYDIVE